MLQLTGKKTLLSDTGRWEKTNVFYSESLKNQNKKKRKGGEDEDKNKGLPQTRVNSGLIQGLDNATEDRPKEGNKAS